MKYLQLTKTQFRLSDTLCLHIDDLTINEGESWHSLVAMVVVKRRSLIHYAKRGFYYRVSLLIGLLVRLISLLKNYKK